MKNVILKSGFAILGGGIFSVVAVSCATRGFNNGGSAEISAAFSASEAGGKKTIKYTSPGGVSEVCVLPKRYPGIKYSKDDDEDEAKLCGLNFYKDPSSADAGEAVALCPKVSSTFPGVEAYELDGINKKSYETEKCANDKRPSKRLAKFKQSTSCSYTGSILGYYHLSRILGDAGNVPAAVIRTMDVAQHKIIARRGVDISSDLNQTLWKQVLNMDSSASNKSFFTNDGKTVFGALSKNPVGEERYAPINDNVGENSRNHFLDEAEVQAVFDSNSVGSIVKRDLANAAPKIQQMIDISDLVLLDHIFQQQDRFGNIHFLEYFYSTDAQGKLSRTRLKRNDDGSVKTAKPAPNAVVVKRMLLKDNDCGNRVGDPRAFTSTDVSDLRHMRLRTYKGIRYLAQTWDTQGSDFFKREALANSEDTFGDTALGSGLGKRIKSAAATLEANCKSGKLLLDLSIEDHLAGKNTPEIVKSQCSAILEADKDDSNSGGGNAGSGSTGGGGSSGGEVPTAPVCTSAPVNALAAAGSRWTLIHGPAANTSQFSARLVTIAGKPSKLPDLTHKFDVTHDATDRSNIGFKLDAADGSKISGIRYNMLNKPTRTDKFSAQWKCDHYEGTFTFAGGTSDILTIKAD